MNNFESFEPKFGKNPEEENSLENVEQKIEDFIEEERRDVEENMDNLLSEEQKVLVGPIKSIIEKYL